MLLSEIDPYQQLIEEFPELQNVAHKEAFDKYIERMWTKPSRLKDYFQAYLEFTTPEKPTFGKLNAMNIGAKKQAPAPKKSKRRRSRRGRRRSRSQRKQN